jgi:hypothetical protein
MGDVSTHRHLPTPASQSFDLRRRLQPQVRAEPKSKMQGRELLVQRGAFLAPIERFDPATFHHLGHPGRGNSNEREMTQTLPPPTPTSAPAPAPKRRRRWPWIVGGSTAVLVVIGAATGAGSKGPTSEAQSSATAAPATVPAPAPTAAPAPAPTATPVTDAPAPVTEAPAPVIEAPAPITVSPPSTDEGEITMDEFNQIQMGMSQDQVTAIVGGAGELLSQSDLVGIHTEMRMWDGPSLGANANVMFQDGKVITKAQFGL